ncbi:MAG: hypothetical protein AAF826_02475 [Pseudomonadota bacterium]
MQLIKVGAQLALSGKWIFKNRRSAILALCVCASPVASEDWVAMSGDDIQASLTDIRLEYEGAWQEFYLSGRTLYNAGRDSWGAWRVEGDRYCSQWPPNSSWACYDMSRKGEMLRFTDPKGNNSDGVIAELKK